MAIEGDIQAMLEPLAPCYPLIAPQGAVAPYLIYQVVSNVPLVTLDGPNGTENNRFQIDAYSATYGGAKALAKQAKDALSGAGHVPLSSRDLRDDETQLFRVSMDFSVWAQ